MFLKLEFYNGWRLAGFRINHSGLHFCATALIVAATSSVIICKTVPPGVFSMCTDTPPLQVWNICRVIAVCYWLMDNSEKNFIYIFYNDYETVWLWWPRNYVYVNVKSVWLVSLWIDCLTILYFNSHWFNIHLFVSFQYFIDIGKSCLY